LGSSNDSDSPSINGLAHPVWIHGLDLCVAMVGVGHKAGLAASKGVGGDAHIVQRHAHEGDGFSFASGDEHVHLATWRICRNERCQTQQLIGFFAHGTDNENDLIAPAATTADVISHLSHPIGVSDRRASKFLNY
jgi:hypothetical protein